MFNSAIIHLVLNDVAVLCKKDVNMVLSYILMCPHEEPEFWHRLMFLCSCLQHKSLQWF